MADKEKITQLQGNDENDSGENNNIVKANISEEMQGAYLDYAMSVIVSRALPDIRDGLKPVHRRIVYAMQDQNMTAANKFNKCAAVIGEVMKKYHPHGDTAIYDSLVRMAQDFSLRYPLIIPQGNFGSIDGDPAAAMRYTECKMGKIAEELYTDIDKETVPFIINDLQNEEPMFLPSKLPNVLLNGASGIAVGMATNIPPHNLPEVVDGLVHLIETADNIGEAPVKSAEKQVVTPDFSSEATVEDLVKYIKGPDFPTGGIIYDHKEMVRMYATGKGRVVTRAKISIEALNHGKSRLVVTEIPYQVNKSNLMKRIADNVKKGKIQGITDLRDESDRSGLRMVIETKRGAIPKKVENQLYKYTQLQTTFNTNMVALLNGEPKLLTLKTILEEFIKHRQVIIINRIIFLLKRAKAREHILMGLKIALDNLDAVIKLIRASKDVETARIGLMQGFNLSDIQARAILDMQLRRLAALERQKIEDELRDILETIDDHEDLLASPSRIIGTVKKELIELKETYGDERRSRVVRGKAGEISTEDIVANEECIITISDEGYIKRLKKTAYKKQGRGGKGVKGTEMKDTDSMDTIKICETHDWGFFFTSKGKVYKMRVWEIPESGRTSKGTALVNFLGVSVDEKVQSFLTISPKQLSANEGYVLFATRKGKVKKTGLDEYENIRSSGIIAVGLEKDDSLVTAKLTTGKDHVFIATAKGKAIRFDEKGARPMGRTAKGVGGIKLGKEDDAVISMVVVSEGNEAFDVVTVSERGYGKKTALGEYRAQSRGGSGLITYGVSNKTGGLVAVLLESTENQDKPRDVLVATQEGKVIRIGGKQIPRLSRNTLGVRLIRLKSSDKVSSVALLD